MIAKSKVYDLTATNAVWIALATLHHRFPDAEDFTESEIEKQVEALDLFQKNPKTIAQHITQHLTATKRANAKPRRMLTLRPNGRYRLFTDGDEYHDSRMHAPTHPQLDEIPPEFRPMLQWYQVWNSKLSSHRVTAIEEDPLLALRGTWTFGDADIYLHEHRNGWKR